MIDLLKIALILGVTVVLLVRKWDLGLLLLLDAVVVAVLFGYPPLPLLKSMGLALIAKDTLNLAGAVFLVLMLAELLRRTRSMDRMVGALQIVVPDSRIVLGLLPALIGLMPMLGGAMFSAPMIDELGKRANLSAERKTFINYWFRHSMEYVFPLYSSLLMVSALIGVTVYEFVHVSWPLSLTAFAGGTIWGLWGVNRQPAMGDTSNKRAAWRDLLFSTWPLILVILAVVGFKLPMLWSLAAIIALVLLIKRIGPAQWPDVLKRSLPLKTFSAIFGVMVFKHVLNDAGAVETIPAALSSLGLPPLLVAFVVPHVVALLTGTAPATMALSIPLVAPLLAPLPIDPIAAGVWMFVGGFSGIMLSPLHLCLALTKDYFGAAWGKLYRSILPAVSLVVLVAAGIVVLTPRA